MLKTKILIKNLDSKFIDLDSRINFYDLDLKRVSTYVYNLENKRFNTIKKTSDLKLFEMLNLKHNLNLKKKVYIDSLRAIYTTLVKENHLSLYNTTFKFKSFEGVLKTLKDLKIIKGNDNIGYFIVLNFYLKIKDTDILHKLISINSDIVHISDLIKSFNTYYKNLLNYRLKVNSYDLKQLEKNILTQNIKEMYYFYLIKLKKAKGKNHIYRQNLKDKITFNLISDTDIKRLLEHNFKINFKKVLKEMPILSETLKNNILNKYI